MGGGGYPTHAKLSSAVKAGASLLIINALECEPLISCDEALIEACPDDIIKGINILIQLLQPSRCVIAVKDDMMQAQKELRQAVTRHADQQIEIVTLPDIYPIGSEKLLIYCLTGIRLDASHIPAASGIVCQNVASVKGIFDCVVLGQPITSRIITVAGENIKEPVNLRTRLGTPVQALLANCTERAETGRRLSLGGPLNGYPLHHADAPVDAHHNCILSNPAEARDVQPCIKCGYCAEVCPVELLPQRLLWHTQTKQLDQLIKLNIAECIECGACDAVCPSKLPLTASFRYAKGQMSLDSQQRSRASAMQARFQKHQQRLLAQETSRQQGLQEKSLKRDKKAAAEIIQAALKRVRNAKSQGEKK
jgi:electron transport complex protein RnfC